MNYIYAAIVIIFGLVSNTVAFASEQKIMVNAKLLFIPDDKSKAIEEIADFKLYNGNMSEIHSYEKRLLSGGYWNIEVRLTETTFNTLFWKSKGVKDGNPWKESGRDVLVNQNLDVSLLQSKSITLMSNTIDTGMLLLNISPSAIPQPLDLVELKVDNFGLDHYCFNNSAVVVDDYYYLGELTGFGQRLYVGVAGLRDINIALKKINDWEVIGEYNNGTISIDMEEGHTLHIMNVGIGPSGYLKGGPFKVFGEVTDPEKTKESSLDFKLMMLQRKYKGEKLKIMEDALKNAPYLMGRATIAGGGGTYEYIDKAIGTFFEGRDCG